MRLLGHARFFDACGQLGNLRAGGIVTQFALNCLDLFAKNILALHFTQFLRGIALNLFGQLQYFLFPVDMLQELFHPFFDNYNPDQFEILGITDRGNEWGLKTKEYTTEETPNANDLNRRAAIKTEMTYKPTYARLLIRSKK